MTATTRLTLPPVPPTIRTLHNEESRSLDLRSKLTFTPERCVTCLGQRWFLWRDSYGNPAEFDCDCKGQYRLFRYLLHCGIPLNYQRLGWNDLEYVDQPVIDAMMDYLDHRQSYINAGFGLVAHGSKGNGKSLLAYLLVKRLIADGVTCFATQFADLVDSYAQTWRDPEQEKWYTATIRNAQVLFINDVGREFKSDRFGDATKTDEQKKVKATADNRPGSMKETLLESVIRYRTASALPTIIDTNYTPEDLLAGYGGHTMSLLAEKSVFVPVTGPDRRPEMNRRESEYIRQGLKRPVVIG